MTLPPLSPNAWLRWDLVSRLLPPNIHAVLEVGCGQGGFGARISQRYRYVGLEPDPVSYAVAIERLAVAAGNGEVRNGDLSALLPEETFDLVCAFEVIEHIEHDEKALAEWVARLRPGGWILLSTPAFQHRFGPADAMAGHFRRYDPPMMARLLRETGLNNIHVEQFGGPLGFVLETARNQIGKRRTSGKSAASMAEKTSGSGRLLQPSSRLQGAATKYGTLPFRLIQRRWPGHGPGLVARAQLPA
ncbi:class I SAM-dependent methyltransferase [Actinopolymorpha alba]|uniref:class I SAM-dependent methyltransferase n=1 Tax=Actinopolymorpha alba TaxID=533267 RepID=UPI00036378DB|nr:class I SAM-dependent methyltransferase [Actinopolymorpha alba]